MSHQECLSQTRLALNTYISLAFPVFVLSCFACLVFRTILRQFKATKTRSGVNVMIKSAVYPQSAVCSLQSAFYADRRLTQNRWNTFNIKIV